MGIFLFRGHGGICLDIPLVSITDLFGLRVIRHGVLRHNPERPGVGAISIIVNITLRAGGVVAGRLGDPAGRVCAATDAVCAAILGVIFVLLLLGMLSKQLVRHMYRIFQRGLSRGAPHPVTATLHAVHPPVSAPCAAPVPLQPADKRVEADSGTSSIATSTRIAGRSPCQSHCVWRFGVQTNAPQPTACQGKRATPSTLLYAGWFTQGGRRT